MHSAIFVAKMPEKDTTWSDFVMNLPTAAKNGKNVVRIAETVWQVNFHENPEALGVLIAYAARFHIDYGILPLPAAPEWLPASFDPSTK